jgi:hypothetical protein
MCEFWGGDGKLLRHLPQLRTESVQTNSRQPHNVLCREFALKRNNARQIEILMLCGKMIHERNSL